jgi:hypothetical protein
MCVDDVWDNMGLDLYILDSYGMMKLPVVLCDCYGGPPPKKPDLGWDLRLQ